VDLTVDAPQKFGIVVGAHASLRRRRGGARSVALPEQDRNYDETDDDE